MPLMCPWGLERLPFWFPGAPAETLPSGKFLTLGAMSHGSGINTGKPRNSPSPVLKPLLWSPELETGSVRPRLWAELRAVSWRLELLQSSAALSEVLGVASRVGAFEQLLESVQKRRRPSEFVC